MSKYIIVIDDSRTVRHSIQFAVEKFGMPVMQAENGMDALQKISILKENRNDIGLCIVDINMPMMDGITFIKEFRKDDHFTPILVISTESSMDKVSEGMSAGASGWINKPFDIAELNSTLQKFFRS